MKTKIVYVLTIDSVDNYFSQILLSVYSLRNYNPHCFVELVTDQDSVRKAPEVFSILNKYINKTTIHNIPNKYTCLQKSRYLKTSLRSIVQGDFLYIDIDTLIRHNLSDVESFNSSICAVADGNEFFQLQSKLFFQKKIVNQIGWSKELDNAPWFNGGVLYVKDTPDSYIFFNAWHKNWEISMEHGIHQDQPALCRANKECGFPISYMDASWNCQLFGKGINNTESAKIIHYFANRERNDFMSSFFLNIIKVNPNLVDTVFKHFQNELVFSISKEKFIFLNKTVDFQNLHQFHPITFQFFHTSAKILNYLFEKIHYLRKI